MEIDDKWQQGYGELDFDLEKFPDPKGMVDELHELGFKVTLWVMPFIEENTDAYREVGAVQVLFFLFLLFHLHLLHRLLLLLLLRLLRRRPPHRRRHHRAQPPHSLKATWFQPLNPEI
jgi:hypothetical protein